jgi:cobalamin biosynthesis protein CobT
MGYTTTDGGRSVPQEGFDFDRTIPIQIDIFKNFTDKYMAVKTKLGCLTANSCNIDGEAVRISGQSLMTRKEKRKIMLVLSDGMPNGDTESKWKLYANLKDEVRNCRNQGIEVYAFGIETDLPKRFYGKDNFVYVPEVEKLGQDFFGRLKEIMLNGGKVEDKA